MPILEDWLVNLPEEVQRREVVDVLFKPGGITLSVSADSELVRATVVAFFPEGPRDLFAIDGARLGYSVVDGVVVPPDADTDA